MRLPKPDPVEVAYFLGAITGLLLAWTIFQHRV